MERVEGYFENSRRKNSPISALMLMLIGIMLLMLTLLLKSALFILFLFLFVIAVFIIGLSSNPSKTKANMAIKLALIKVGESFRIEQAENNGTERLFDNLKCRELIIVEYIETVKDDYYDYHDVVVARQLQLRIWNEKEQVVLIEKLEKQSVDGIKVFKMTELHQADFISLELGTLQKMDDLMNISESIWE